MKDGFAEIDRGSMIVFFCILTILAIVNICLVGDLCRQIDKPDVRYNRDIWNERYDEGYEKGRQRGYAEGRFSVLKEAW